MFKERGFIGVFFFLFLGISLIIGILMLKGWQSHNMAKLLRENHHKSMQIEDLYTMCHKLELQRNALSSRAIVQAFASQNGLTARGDSIQVPVILEVSQ